MNIFPRNAPPVARIAGKATIVSCTMIASKIWRIEYSMSVGSHDLEGELIVRAPSHPTRVLVDTLADVIKVQTAGGRWFVADKR